MKNFSDLFFFISMKFCNIEQPLFLRHMLSSAFTNFYIESLIRHSMSNHHFHWTLYVVDVNFGFSAESTSIRRPNHQIHRFWTMSWFYSDLQNLDFDRAFQNVPCLPNVSLFLLVGALCDAKNARL